MPYRALLVNMPFQLEPSLAACCYTLVEPLAWLESSGPVLLLSLGTCMQLWFLSLTKFNQEFALCNNNEEITAAFVVDIPQQVFASPTPAQPAGSEGL